MIKIALLLTGGPHQSLHLLPLIPELHDLGTDVRVFAMEERTQQFCSEFLQSVEMKDSIIALLHPTMLERMLTHLRIVRKSKKLRIIGNTRHLRGFDAILVAERTSSILKRHLKPPTLMIHIPHGAGDRRAGFDQRAKLYDFHIVSGDKDRHRFIEEGIAGPDRVATSGSIKLAGVYRRPAKPQQIFSDDRPVILYTPHFDTALSSWHRIGFDVIEAIAALRRYNLIVAPHVRLRSGLRSSEISRLERCAAADVHIDLGSVNSYDMTYTRAADIYLGDVSSQVYEFLVEPRPCVFLNTVNAVVEGNPDFRMWMLGEIASDVPSALSALDRAAARHPEFAPRQKQFFEDAMGSNWMGAPRIAARQILDVVARRNVIPG